MTLVAAADPIWRWQPHPEVWLLVAAVIGLGFYAARVIGPKVVPAGVRAVTRRQVIAFYTGVVCLWIASDWPMHDISEERLYSVHMFQHMIFTLVLPPLFLLATPRWLADLIVRPQGPAWAVIRRLARPIPATLIFQLFGFFAHWPVLVDAAVANGPLHYSIHTAFVFTGILMWIPICGPWSELRLSLPGQMVYLFVQSVIPTVPAAWLTYAGSPIYDVYVNVPRLWGISVMDDQVAAGIIMKVIETAYVWTIITALFFTWAGRHMEADREGLSPTEREISEWDAAEHGPPASTRGSSG